jgi:hypothetical protein
MDDNYKAVGCVGWVVTTFVCIALLLVVGLVRGDLGDIAAGPTAWLLFISVGVVFRIGVAPRRFF